MRAFFLYLSRDVPSSAAFPIIKPALGSSSSSSRKAISEMQDYLDRFLGSLDIVNTREVLIFLEFLLRVIS
jgi:phospholipase D1/2